MTQIKISVNIPHLQKEYDVNVTDTITGEKLYKTFLKRDPSLSESDENIYEMFSKRIGKKVWPDFKSSSLKDIGIQEGDTIIVKKDLDPGGYSSLS